MVGAQQVATPLRPLRRILYTEVSVVKTSLYPLLHILEGLSKNAIQTWKGFNILGVFVTWWCIMLYFYTMITSETAFWTAPDGRLDMRRPRRATHVDKSSLRRRTGVRRSRLGPEI